MGNDLPVLGLICARGGSKGVPGKNIRMMCGKPLIAWSIEAGIACPEISEVVVSTDDENIARVAREFGADVPFMRPDALARDDARQIDAIVHALEFLKVQGREYRAVALLQPTCPLRLPEDISGSLALLDKSGADTVITVTEVDGVYLSQLYDVDENGAAQTRFPASKTGTLRQDYKPLYHRCGLVYVLRPDYVLRDKVLYGEKIAAYRIPKARSFDIDSAFDWDMSEWLLQRQMDKNE